METGLVANVAWRRPKVINPVMNHVLDSISEGITVVDSTGRIIGANDATARLYGYNDNRELIGRNLFEFIVERDYTCVAENLKRMLEGSSAGGVECTFLTKNGKEFTGKFSTVSLKNIHGSTDDFIVIVEDTNKTKETEARLLVYRRKLQSLAHELSLAEENERRRIAVEIHDHVSQALALCSIKLGYLLKSVPPARVAEGLGEIHNIIKQIIEEVRSLTFQLDSPLLYEFGLEVAVERLTEQMQEQQGVRFSFEDDGQPKPLADDVRVLLFQTIRELLINVIKHAKAKNVEVCIKRQKRSIQITVKDDGIGFDVLGITSARKGTEGFGLFSIQQRLDSIGGQFLIESKEGCGTRVTIVAPLSSNRTRT